MLNYVKLLNTFPSGSALDPNLSEIPFLEAPEVWVAATATSKALPSSQGRTGSPDSNSCTLRKCRMGTRFARLEFDSILGILDHSLLPLQLRLEPRTPSTTTHAMSCFAGQPCRQGMASKFVKDVPSEPCWKPWHVGTLGFWALRKSRKNSENQQSITKSSK